MDEEKETEEVTHEDLDDAKAEQEQRLQPPPLKLRPVLGPNRVLIGFELVKGEVRMSITGGDARRLVVNLCRTMPKDVWKGLIRDVWQLRGDDSKLKLVGSG